MNRWTAGFLVLGVGLLVLSLPEHASRSIGTAEAQFGASTVQDSVDLFSGGKVAKGGQTDIDTLVAKKVFALPEYVSSSRPTCDGSTDVGQASGQPWMIFNTTTKSVEVCNDEDGSYGWDPISYDGDGDGLGRRTRAGVTVDEDDDDVNNQPVRGDFSIPSSTVGTPGASSRTVTYSVPDGVYGSGDDVSFTMPGDGDLVEDKIKDGENIFGVGGNHGRITNQLSLTAEDLRVFVGIPVPVESEFFDTAAAGARDPRGIAVTSTRIYVVDISDDEVYAFNHSGVEQTSESFSTAAAGARDPQGMAVTSTRIYVVDPSDDEVYAFNHSGVEQTSESFSTAAAGAGDPRGIAVTSTRIYVADFTDDKVYAFNHSGNYQSTESFSTSPYSPRGLSATDTRIYIISDDANYYKVNVFDHSGVQLPGESFIARASSIEGIAVTDTHFFTVNTGADRVEVFIRQDYPALASDNNARAFCAAAGRQWLEATTTTSSSTAPAYTRFTDNSGLIFDFAIGNAFSSVSCGDLNGI